MTLLVLTTANILIIPFVLPFRQFLAVTARLSAILVIIGLFPYLGAPVQLPFIDLSLWGGDIYWSPSLRPITSIFINPNQLGGLAVVGSIAAIFEGAEKPSKVSVILFCINAGGLLMTNWRTGWIILIVSIVLYAAYIYGGSRLFILLASSLLFGIVVGISMAVNVLPGPRFISELSLNGRIPRWEANMQALMDQPLWGYGFTGVTELGLMAGNPHSSYIRMFSAFGVIGGMLYLIFIINIIISSVRWGKSISTVTLAILLISFSIVQLFNQLTFIGISMRSTFTALTIGYYITNNDV
jgi:O-antigen ligase